MVALRGLTVSVGYADLLKITLVRNMRHMIECVVVTSPQDEATQAVVKATPGARLSVTDAFTRHHARFNKGLAIEEAGFDYMGRHGWIALHDADILLPDVLPFDRLRPDCLHGAKRRILDDPSKWHPGFDWNGCPPSRDGGPIGFFQLFHADAPCLPKGTLPSGKHEVWYDVSFPHGGGGDAAFMEHWPRANRVVLPMEVLHLGRNDVNWFGCDDESRDLMAKYVHQNQWRRAMKNFDQAAVRRAGRLPERIEVPGYPPSSYRLPFERRAQDRRP